MDREWEEEYIRYLNDEKLSEIEIGKIMEQYRPAQIYRYKSRNLYKVYV